MRRLVISFGHAQISIAGSSPQGDVRALLTQLAHQLQTANWNSFYPSMPRNVILRSPPCRQRCTKPL